MPRKKMVRPTKGKKVQATRKPKTLEMSAEKMEKDFRDAPSKLISQYRKDAAASKQQGIKLKTELKKAQILEKAVKNKHTLLSSKPKTPALKKQIASAKKVHAELKKSITDFTKKLGQIQKQNDQLAQKQAKFSALKTQLATFEKEFAKKQTKVTKPVKKAKTPKAAKQTQPAMDELKRTEVSSPVTEIESEIPTEA